MRGLTPPYILTIKVELNYILNRKIRTTRPILPSDF